MDIQDNHFALFGLPERFGLDAAALDRAYREVQTQVHPDRFAGSGATEQRIALQWATRANEAYRVLRDPLQRAIYLCTLRGEDPADEQNTKMPQAFLMQQLEWREALDDAKANGDVASIDRLREELDAMRATLKDDVTNALDRDGDAPLASGRARLWMFVERFGEDVQAAKRQIEASVH
jgi:molecular chaperone HscB